MDFPVEIVKNGKTLRCGYTTGSCAAAAASAAARMLLSEEPVCSVRVETPAGIALQLEVEDVYRSDGAVSCAVRKYSGDDPDITDGILICARVEKTAQGIRIDGGTGVGRVTCPGLDQPVGAAAINSTPRRMIRQHLERIGREFGYSGGFSVEISIPEGETLAKKTFNGKLGIVGGLSVLGTTGIVEPMSNHALVESLKLEMKQNYPLCGGNLLLVPGNFGARFARDSLLLPTDYLVSCSNFIGEAIDAAIECGYRKILLIGHVGKLVKLGINIPNTHSAYGDGRIETLVTCALRCRASLDTLKRLSDCVTTDGAIRVLNDAGMLHDVMQMLGRRIEEFLIRHVPESVEIGYLCFTNAEPCAGVLMQSGNVDKLMEYWRK